MTKAINFLALAGILLIAAGFISSVPKVNLHNLTIKAAGKAAIEMFRHAELTQTKYKIHSSGSWNKNTSFRIQGGQAIKFEVKNVNVLGTTITIETNRGTQSRIILPQSTAIFEFTVFGAEPTPWTINVSTESDAFIVAWTLYSTWVPGDPKNGR